MFEISNSTEYCYCGYYYYYICWRPFFQHNLGKPASER